MRRDPRIDVEESPSVYRPSDDTDLLLQALAVSPGQRFLEVGTGTGLIALHAAVTSVAVATDVNPRAVTLARRNAVRNRLPLSVVRCDLMSGVRGPFDVVAFNPPYLAGNGYDDLERAWHGGPTGSEVAIRFLEGLPRVLAPHGRAYVCLSRQNEAARASADDHFHVDVVARKQLFFETLEILHLRRGLK